MQLLPIWRQIFTNIIARTIYYKWLIFAKFLTAYNWLIQAQNIFCRQKSFLKTNFILQIIPELDSYVELLTRLDTYVCMIIMFMLILIFYIWVLLSSFFVMWETIDKVPINTFDMVVNYVKHTRRTKMVQSDQIAKNYVLQQNNHWWKG